MVANWHPDLPPGTEEVWDIVAKALLLRLGGSVTITRDEMHRACETPCLIAIDGCGAAHFRIEGT